MRQFPQLPKQKTQSNGKKAKLILKAKRVSEEQPRMYDIRQRQAERMNNTVWKRKRKKGEERQQEFERLTMHARTMKCHTKAPQRRSHLAQTIILVAVVRCYAVVSGSCNERDTKRPRKYTWADGGPDAQFVVEPKRQHGKSPLQHG